MEEKNNENLEELIAKQLELIDGLEPGSKERAVEVENLNKMIRLRIEIVSTDNDYDIKMNQVKNDYIRIINDESNNKCQLVEQKKDRFVKIACTAGEILIPLGAYAFMFFKGIKFEETGIITSHFLKNLISKFKFKK